MSKQETKAAAVARIREAASRMLAMAAPHAVLGLQTAAFGLAKVACDIEGGADREKPADWEIVMREGLIDRLIVFVAAIERAAEDPDDRLGWGRGGACMFEAERVARAFLDWAETAAREPAHV